MVTGPWKVCTGIGGTDAKAGAARVRIKPRARRIPRTVPPVLDLAFLLTFMVLLLNKYLIDIVLLNLILTLSD
jgi:hypothetical protein